MNAHSPIKFHISKPRTLLELLQWLKDNEHFEGWAKPGEMMYLRGHTAQIDCPADIWGAANGLVRPGDDFGPSCKRMFVLTPAGEAHLIDNGGRL